MSNISFTIPGEPATITAQQKGISFKRKIVFTKAIVKAEAGRIAGWAKAHLPTAPWDNPIRFSIKFVFPLTEAQAKKYADRLSDPKFELPHTVNPDADNLNKLAQDVLSRLKFWVNDSRICDLVVRKRYGSIPRIDITIVNLSEPDSAA